MSMFYTHDRGEGACGKPAAIYLHDQVPQRGEVVRSEDFRTLDGKRIKPESDCICGSCGRSFSPGFTSSLTGGPKP
ncbi:MAG: hypothetical protein IIZ92_15605 [Aquincola sp.]|nr:hypothetical protein [Aquincola sp.]